MGLGMRIAPLFVLACLTFVDVASAAEPKSLGRFRDWEGFVAIEQGHKVCYALTSPKKSSGKYTRRDPAFLMAARRPSEKVYDEVSAIAGYQYQKGSRPEFRIGKRRFVASAVGDVAWPRVKDSRKLANAIRGGSTLTLIGTSARGTRTTDEFSLRGATAAFKAIAKACPKR